MQGRHVHVPRRVCIFLVDLPTVYVVGVALPRRRCVHAQECVQSIVL